MTGREAAEVDTGEEEIVTRVADTKSYYMVSWRSFVLKYVVTAA